MSSVLLEYPKGLGDHLRFSAIVRDYCSMYDRVGIFATEQTYDSVAFLYRTLGNLHIHKANSSRERHADGYDQHIQIEPDEESGVAAERLCYAMADVPFERRWSAFKLERDTQREKSCFDSLAPTGAYIFIHDDERYHIDPTKISTNLPAVRPVGTNRPIFDYCLLLERASELHVIDSSFMFLIDQLEYHAPAQKLFVHRYARPLRPFYLPILKKSWHIL